MSWSNLKAGISAVVKENNNQEITGTNLQNVLITIVNSLGANATCGGIAHPNTSPGTPDGPVFWIASRPGVYVNFGNTEIDNIGIFTWNGTSWSFEELDFMKNMQTDIANSVLQSVSFGVTGNTATLTIKQKGYDAITVSVPIATGSQSGFMTAADKDKLDSTYSKQEIDAEVDAIRDAIKKKQDKLVAGDDATRLNGAKLSTKQIFTGSIATIAGAVPMLLPTGGCIYNSADKKLYIGDSNSQPVEVAKPNDFLFFSNGKLYHYQFGNFGEVETGTTLVAGDKATRIIDDNLETKQIYRGTVINTNGEPVGLAVGAYCFNIATKKLYVGAQHGNAMVTDTVPMPDDFLFVDTASGTTYRCDGTTLHNIANIKTINGHSLLGGGNVQLTGADFLLEQGAGLTINEAVNSNTDALQNKLDKASIVQTTGTATDKVMSQKSVTDYVPDYCATLRSYTANEAWKATNFNVSNLARTRNTYSTATKPYVFVRSTAAASSYIPNTVAFVVSTVAISLDEHYSGNIIKAVTDGMVLYNINGNWYLVVKRSDSKVLDHQFATRLASGFNWAVLLDYRASKLTFKATNTAGSTLLEESVDLSSLDIDFGDVYYLAGLGTNGIVPDVIFSYNDLYVTIDSYSDPLTCGNSKIAGTSGVSDTTGANLTDGLNTTAMDAIYTTHSYDSDTGAYTGSLSSDSYTTKSVLQVKDAIAKFNSNDTVWRVTLKVTGSMTIKANWSNIDNWIIKDLTAGTEEKVSSVAADHALKDGHEYEFIYKASWNSGDWFFAKGDFTAVWSGLQWLSMLHTDITPSNYDGKMIKGNIDFYYDSPLNVTTVPQVIVGTSNPWNVVGTQRVDTSGNIYYKVKSGTSLIEKKINNT